MLVIENVVLAEAVIPRAAGAVPERKLRMVGVRPAADLALVAVALTAGLFRLLFRGLLELDGSGRALVPGEKADVR